MPLIAVATENPELLDAIHRAFAQSDFTSMEVSAGLELLRVVFESQPEAVLMDLDLADVEGFELLRILRAASDVPVLALTADPDPEIVARALDLGADDVAQPDTPPVELVARLRAALRRTSRVPPPDSETMLIRTGALEIDRAAKEVRKHGEPIPLTRTEYRLLDALAARVGQMAPHRFLLSVVWGDAYTDDTHYLRVYIGYLRAKLEDDPARPRYLVNEWGMGYRLAQLPVTDGEPAEEPTEAPGEREEHDSAENPASLDQGGPVDDAS